MISEEEDSRPSEITLAKKGTNMLEFAGNFDDLANRNIGSRLQNLNVREEIESQSVGKSIIDTIAYYLNTVNPLEWIFIIYYTLVLTVICFLFDLILDWSLNFRAELCNSQNQLVNLILWVVTCVILTQVATSVGYYISPDADGSGIPEVKTVLSGISIYRYFSIEALLAKLIGLWAGLSGGISVGKVGPFVHIATIVCNRLMKVKLFSKINNSVSKKNSMIAAAAAAGMALALGTPVGGVIFSMEVTASIYLVSNLVKAFASTTICILLSKFLKVSSNQNIFSAPEHLPPMTENVILDYTLVIILGVISGIVGALLSTSVSRMALIRKKSTHKFLNSRFVYAFIVSLITALIQFSVKPLMLFDRTMLSYLFNVEFPEKLDQMNHPHEGMLLFACFVFKLFLTIITLAMNVPAGIFGPFLVIGAYFGRFYGHIFNLIFNISEESIYAMIGAAAVMSGATHSISAAFIIFELTGQVSYLFPMLLACIISNLTAQSLALSFFDVILLMKNLPYLPNIKSNTLYNKTAEEMTSKELYPVLINNFDFITSLEVLFKMPPKYARVVSIPIIGDDGIIKYTVNPKNLTKYIFHIYEGYKLNYETEIQHKIETVVFYLRKKMGKKYASFYQYIRAKINNIFKKKEKTEDVEARKMMEDQKIEELLIFLRDYSENDDYILKSKIDIFDKTLRADRSAFAIEKNLQCLRLQFLFTFLNVSHLYVSNKGALCGVIIKEDFVKKSMLLN